MGRKLDDGRILVLGKSGELFASVGKHLSSSRPEGAGRLGKAALVRHKLGDEVVEVIGRPRGIAAAQSGGPENAQYGLDVAQRLWSEWRGARKQARRVSVREQAAAEVVRHLGQLLLPASARLDDRHFSADLVCQEYE